MKNPFKAVLQANMQKKLIIVCIIIIVPVFAASLFLIGSIWDVLQEYDVNDIKSETEILGQRYYEIIDSAENFGIGLENAFARFTAGETEVLILPQKPAVVDSFIIYSDFSQPENQAQTTAPETAPPVKTAQTFAPLESVSGTAWYKTAAETDKPFWTFTALETTDFRFALIIPLYVNGEFEGVAALFAKDSVLSEVSNSANVSAVLTFDNGMIFYSDTPDQYPVMNMMPVEAYADKPVVVDDNFISGDTFVVMSEIRPLGTGETFRVYLTVPYSNMTSESRNAVLVYIWYVILCLILSILFAILFSGFFTRRINFLGSQMNKVMKGDLDLSENLSGNDEINRLYTLLRQMVKSMTRLGAETAKARLNAETFRLNKTEAEFKALASQINPHFLYNTLETIRMKAYSSGDKDTAELIKILGKFMRRSLKVSEGFVTLESELDFTHNYLKLQSARFGQRVRYNIYSEVSKEFEILPLIIQPLVENAYAHGVEGVKQNGYILIAIRLSGKNVVIEVKDNGRGMDEDALEKLRLKINSGDTSSGKSIGLTNVNMRIKMVYGVEYGMEVDSEVNYGTTVRIRLPRNDLSFGTKK
ncbi:MAG: histidine kinase [Ruminococcus sp.]|jgi:two-component system sensor histidine kinase YesM|nr:histidine kinase [Ruminococcus sp.]